MQTAGCCRVVYRPDPQKFVFKFSRESLNVLLFFKMGEYLIAENELRFAAGNRIPLSLPNSVVGPMLGQMLSCRLSLVR
jgi:hypothetical protein